MGPQAIISPMVNLMKIAQDDHSIKPSSSS